jgi:hypothetical protein
VQSGTSFFRKEILIMKLTTRSTAILLAIGLLVICAEGAFAGPAVGGYFSAGNPGGLRYSSHYPMAQTPANQFRETSNAWANYNAQLKQIPGSDSSTGTSR